MNDRDTTIEELKEKVREFVREREWRQFHSPKNLSMSLAIEAAELMEMFQWLTTEQSQQLSTSDRRRVREELADIVLYVLDMCDTLNIDLSGAVKDKLAVNARKYPVGLTRGKAQKWTHYEGESHGK